MPETTPQTLEEFCKPSPRPFRISDKNVRGSDIPYEVIQMPDGMEEIRLKEGFRLNNVDGTPAAIITGPVTDGNSLIRPLLISDALQSVYPYVDVTLRMTYCSYSRSDRVTALGRSVGMDVVDSLVKDTHYLDTALVLSPHAQSETMSRALTPPVIDWPDEKVYIGPDANALKRFRLDKGWNMACVKSRNLNTGDVSVEMMFNYKEKPYPYDYFHANHNRLFVIRDDIFDGGASFLHTAKTVSDHYGIPRERLCIAVDHFLGHNPNVLRELDSYVYAIYSNATYREPFYGCIPETDIKLELREVQ